jgi:hypothetical protein
MGRSVPLIRIVDDDEAVREFIGGFVKSGGYKSNVFESAESFDARWSSTFLLGRVGGAPRRCVRKPYRAGFSKADIARGLRTGRTSVRRNPAAWQ